MQEHLAYPCCLRDVLPASLVHSTTTPTPKHCIAALWRPVCFLTTFHVDFILSRSVHGVVWYGNSCFLSERGFEYDTVSYIPHYLPFSFMMPVHQYKF